MSRSLFDCDIRFDCGEELVGFHHVLGNGGGKIALETFSDVRLDVLEPHALLVEVEEHIHLRSRQRRNCGGDFARTGPFNEFKAIAIAFLMTRGPCFVLAAMRAMFGIL